MIDTALVSGKVYPRADLACDPGHTAKRGDVGQPSRLGSGSVDQISDAARPIRLVAIHGLPQLSKALGVVATSTALGTDDDPELHSLVTAGRGKRKSGRHLLARDKSKAKGGDIRVGVGTRSRYTEPVTLTTC